MPCRLRDRGDDVRRDQREHICKTQERYSISRTCTKTDAEGKTQASLGVFIIHVLGFFYILRFIWIPDLKLAASLNAVNSPFLKWASQDAQSEVVVCVGGVTGRVWSPVIMAGSMSRQSSSPFSAASYCCRFKNVSSHCNWYSCEETWPRVKVFLTNPSKCPGGGVR